MNREQQIESIIDELAEPISEAIAWNFPTGADTHDLVADIRANVFDYLKRRNPTVALSQTRLEAAPRPEDTRYRIEHIGDYTQREATTMHDRGGQAVKVEAGRYAVMASVSLDGSRVFEGGIVFQGHDARTGEEKTVLQYPSPSQVKELVRAGKVELATGITSEMLEPKQAQSLARTVQPKQAHEVKLHRGGM